MYIVQSHGGCNNDYIWMVLLQNQLDIACNFERIGNNAVPRLLYSPTDKVSIDSKCKY